ncbi:hypothetical protein JW916_04310 [Candidatus Sumerlaeota bacterium]|nr:hypothetical protein [Candidatus Sumerlaeota bacterium]
MRTNYTMESKRLAPTRLWALCAAFAAMAVTCFGGTFSIVDLPATGTDAATGIGTSKTYTHTLDLGLNAPVTINGVAFAQGPTESLSENYTNTSLQGYQYTIADTRTSDIRIRPHNGDDSEAVDPATQADGDSVGLLLDMIYYSGAADIGLGNGYAITLSDLTPGSAYSVRYYYRQWKTEDRTIAISADGGSDGSFIDVVSINIDEGGAHYLEYYFVSDDTDVTVMFVHEVSGNGAHVYGLTCEEAALPTPIDADVQHWEIFD